jgi:hypothetical protein
VLTSKAVAEQLLATPLSIGEATRTAADGGLPAEPGFYAWWSDHAAIPGVPPNPHPKVPECSLFYVGISPARESSAQSIRARVIGNHLRGNTGASTFRLTLAALLIDAHSLHPQARGPKVILPAAENRRLTEWQERNLRLTWVVRPAPWEVEAEVIAILGPPLNLAANAAHPFHHELSAARRRLRVRVEAPPDHRVGATP